MSIFILISSIIVLSIAIYLMQKNSSELTAPKSYLSTLRNRPKSSNF